MVRLPPPDRSTLDAEVDDLLSLATAPSGDTAETIAVMAHCPALVRPFLEWSMALHTEGVLPPRLHEIIALRVAHSLIHCTVNIVTLRFAAFALSSIVLWVMLARLVLEHF